MQSGPLEYMLERSWGEGPVNGASLHFDRNLVFSVNGVEVRYTMLVVEHADYDAEESRKFGHDCVNAQLHTGGWRQ